MAFADPKNKVVVPTNAGVNDTRIELGPGASMSLYVLGVLLFTLNETDGLIVYNGPASIALAPATDAAWLFLTPDNTASGLNYIPGAIWSTIFPAPDYTPATAIESPFKSTQAQSDTASIYLVATNTVTAVGALIDMRGYRIRAMDTAIVEIQGGGVCLDVNNYIPYTPSLAASPTNPVIGNGTVAGEYQYLNRHTVRCSGRITFGSTSSKGSGGWTISLPVPMAGTSGPVGHFFINDSGAAVRDGAAISAGASTIALYLNGTGGSVSGASLTGIFNGSYLMWDITYKVA